jgi:hypothetical protein
MFIFFLSAWIVLVIILQIKKKKQGGSKLDRRIAFFHPFWYFYIDLVMMQVAEKKFFGL